MPRARARLAPGRGRGLRPLPALLFPPGGLARPTAGRSEAEAAPPEGLPYPEAARRRRRRRSAAQERTEKRAKGKTPPCPRVGRACDAGRAGALARRARPCGARGQPSGHGGGRCARALVIVHRRRPRLALISRNRWRGAGVEIERRVGRASGVGRARRLKRKAQADAGRGVLGRRARVLAERATPAGRERPH